MPRALSEPHVSLSQVSSRKQEIADRLNAWTIFNDKNKEFCDWLTQMESKVCHGADLSIEEMVEKLKKVIGRDRTEPFVPWCVSSRGIRVEIIPSEVEGLSSWIR